MAREIKEVRRERSGGKTILLSVCGDAGKNGGSGGVGVLGGG